MKITNLLLALILFTLISCGGNNWDIPLDKPYWTPDDYEMALYELRTNEFFNEKLPTFDDPETSIIIEKLVDDNNYEVVLTDETLGINYKEEMSGLYFDHWSNLMDEYRIRDVQDRYVYELEFLSIYRFGLGMQQQRILTVNNQIISEADDPNESRILNLIQSNKNVLVSNSLLYLDLLNEEKVFSSEGLKTISKTISDQYPKIINQTNGSNYDRLEKKLDLMNKKVKSIEIKSSINEIMDIIEKTKSSEMR
jgi:hypothetical protein